MGKFFYSASSNGFFSEALSGAYVSRDTWPADAIQVSKEEYAKYAKGTPPNGARLGANENGRPAWVPIPQPDLETLAARKRAEIDADSVAALDQVRSDYPDYEQLSWERQEREARDGGGPLIQAIADARGLSLEELISRIIAKADAYQAAAGVVIGRRQALRDQIDAIEADEDLDDDAKRAAIEAITW
ncbi:MAG: hypothetical protein ABN479_19630 [Billgrantia sp.]